jgi:hypothetical protein
MSTLIVTCKCGQKMKVPEDALGKKGSCVACGRAIKITKKSTSLFIPIFTPPEVPRHEEDAAETPTEGPPPKPVEDTPTP